MEETLEGLAAALAGLSEEEIAELLQASKHVDKVANPELLARFLVQLMA